MYNYLIATTLVIIDILIRKYFSRGLFLAVTLPALLATAYTCRLFIIRHMSVLKFLLLPIKIVAFAKIFLLEIYKNKGLKRYFTAFTITYVTLSILLIWINGWGFDKNFQSFNWKVMLGIEGDPNYSSAAFFIATAVLLGEKKIKFRIVILLNLIIFSFLFSRTSSLALILLFSLHYSGSYISNKKLYILNILSLLIICCLPILLLSIHKDLLTLLNFFSSERVGIWYYMMTGTAEFASENYYIRKQPHNALFQIIQYYGALGGTILFFGIHWLLLNSFDRKYTSITFIPLLCIEMFLNSYSAAYFIIYIIGGITRK